MKNQRSKLFLPLIAFFVFVIGIGCVCSGLSGGTPTQPPVQPPPATKAPVQQPTAQPQPTAELPQSTEASSGGWTTFVDQNKLYQIQVPADWTYQQTVDTENNYFYVDTFTSPDNGAVIENIVYDDGKPFTGSDKSKAALFFLNNWYSNTGKEGDIKVTDDSIQKDGSERLIWTSRGGGYSGISFLETRGSTTFLFFTVNWGNSVQDQYVDTLNQVIESYSIP